MGMDFSLKTEDGENLSITTYGLNSSIDQNCIIYVHGFKGFKDWGFVPYIADYMADKEYFVITFNFSHNGIGSDKLEFTELNKFAENTFSREINELEFVIDAYKNRFLNNNSVNKIGLLGHSRGGAVALITGYRKNLINAVTTWASISKLDRYSDRQKKEWKEKGYFEVINSRTKQLMRLNVSLLNDIEENKDGSLNLKNAVQNLNKPLLIAHGEQDLAVPVDEADTLYEWADKSQTELFKINKTGHTFDAKHPFEGSNEKLENLLQKTHSFFSKHLN